MKLRIILFSLCTLLATGNSFAETPAEKGYRIMEAVDSLPVVERFLSENIFKIYDAQGKLVFTKKARSANFVETYTDPKKRLSRSISYFYSPSDDKGNAALMFEIAGKDDDQWLYLKGLRKPKRVIGSDKSSSFMGSDFSNGDVSSNDLEESNYEWLGTDTVQFKGKTLKVDKIKTVFKSVKKREDYGYSKTILWMHKKSGLPFKAEMYDLQDQLYKIMLLKSFKVVKNRDGKKVFMVTGMEMKNILKGTRTEMSLLKLRTESKANKVSPAIFSLQYMTRKWW